MNGEAFGLRMSEDRYVRHVRQKCQECGSRAIEHGRVGSLAERHPDRAASLREGAEWMGGGDELHAWVCLTCDNLGVFGEIHFEDFPTA